MLVAGHSFEIVLVGLGVVSVMYRTIKTIPSWFSSQLHMPSKVSAFLCGCVAVLLVCMMARGTLQHRPINPSLAYFSSDPLVNSLTLNSSCSLAFAIKQLGNEASATQVYGTMDETSIIAYVQAQTAKPISAFNHPELPTLATSPAVYKGKPKNLVIVLQESLGAQFVQSLGGKI